MLTAGTERDPAFTDRHLFAYLPECGLYVFALDMVRNVGWAERWSTSLELLQRYDGEGIGVIPGTTDYNPSGPGAYGYSGGGPHRNNSSSW